MNYFSNFPVVSYKFGNNESPVLFQNISAYVDLIDQIKNNISFYQYYHIQEGERADVLSYEFYETSSYHWTFYLMNDHLKEFGWPLTNKHLEALIVKDFGYTVLTTKAHIATIKLNVGDTVTGVTSTAVGTVVRIDPDLGQVVVDTEDSFLAAGESIQFGTSSFVAAAAIPEYNSAHHFEDEDGNWVDIDPTVNLQPTMYTEVTHADMYRRQNDAQRQIVIIRPDAIDEIVGQYKRVLRG